MIRRNPSLDLLRGLAIAMVALTHCSHVAKSAIPGLHHFSWYYGELGVQLFFIVSGYTMMLTFGDKVDLSAARSFYIRRAFRIVPLFWIATVFYLLVQIPENRVWAPNGIGPAEVALTFLFLQWSSPTAFNSIVPGGWSIAVEMQFYLLFPLLICVFRTKNGPLICYALIALVNVVAQFAADHFLMQRMAASLPANEVYLSEAFYFWWLPRQLICFGFGILLYDFIELKNRPTIGALLLIGAGLFSSWTSEIVVLAAAAFVILALNMRAAPLGLLGRHSYAIYLFHFAFVWLFGKIPSIDLVLLFALVLGSSLATSYFIVEPLIERRFNRLGHQLANSRNSPALQPLA
ncbi:MAG: acyltransferase [Xanthobacteraceae bacterium]|nr:acyltransferase [Xanthobacteraceae bacterium]